MKKPESSNNGSLKFQRFLRNFSCNSFFSFLQTQLHHCARLVFEQLIFSQTCTHSKFIHGGGGGRSILPRYYNDEVSTMRQTSRLGVQKIKNHALRWLCHRHQHHCAIHTGARKVIYPTRTPFVVRRNETNNYYLSKAVARYQNHVLIV